VNYRGYTASPLLGTPEGISVFVDGVRQPFGDVVSWDLIENNAISGMTLTPGSNLVFGLNTLGAAASVTTKDGVTALGLSGAMRASASVHLTGFMSIRSGSRSPVQPFFEKV
jgi:hypothetical protein